MMTSNYLSDRLHDVSLFFNVHDVSLFFNVHALTTDTDTRYPQPACTRQAVSFALFGVTPAARNG